MDTATNTFAAGVVRPDTRVRVLPPWAGPASAPGRGTVTRELDPGLASRSREFAASCGMSLEALLTGVWAATWARCTGDDTVSTVVVTADGRLRWVSLATLPRIWMDLFADLRSDELPADAAAAAVLSLNAVVDDVHAGSAVVQDAAVVLSVYPADNDLILEARFRTELVEGRSAQRLLGYLSRMLTAVVVDGLTAPADLSRILDDDEVAEQLHGRIGPVVANGPALFTEHFEHRARATPDALAVVHGERSTTYAELETRSRAVAHALRAAGVSPGDPVAVVSDRHTDWVMLLLGVLRARGVYLPIRPDCPPGRAAEQLRRAACSVAVADTAGAPLVEGLLRGADDEASPARWDGRLLGEAELAPGPQQDDALAPANPEDPAYVYFTSGSTGSPKGAVCAHDGMVNHLWAKVDDHALTAGDVVSQTASQCFDISLWQVCAPLMVGGSVVVVDTDDQLDVDRFVDLLDRRHVTVAQIVPSYLEVLLARIEAGGVLAPSLRSVSVTGEALRAELVRRWFSMVQGVELVNAYGATEVSDDTMHKVLREPPVRELPIVDVGRPLRNMRVYITDDRLRLLPTGARGEIVFAGVCVGLGYLNDAERTADAFVDDPFVRGERLYRSGDYGRWLPEGLSLIHI